jgi:DamX protein
MKQDSISENTLGSAIAQPFFKPSNWLAKINFINHLVLLNDVVMAVLAEHGGGKTTFIKLLAQGLDDSINTHVFKANPPFDSHNLIAELAQIYKCCLDTPLDIALIIKQINKQKKYFLLIIDDAQNLPLAFLQEILNEIKQHENNNFFHVCLVSDFALVPRLCVLEANEFTNMIHTIELGALTESETNTYLQKKAQIPAHINKTALQAFYQLTGGNIARINSQMNAFFNLSSPVLKKSKKITTKQLCLTGSLLILMLLPLYLWQTDFSFSMPSFWQSPSSVVTKNQGVLTSKIPAFSTASIRQVLQPTPLNRIVDYGDDDDSNLDNMVIMDKVVVIPKAMYRHRIENPMILSSSIASIGTLLAKTPAPMNEVSVSVAKGNNVAFANKGRYTIQLLASLNQNDLKRFIVAHHIKNETKISISKRQGVTWYVLTMGAFHKSEHAKSAINNLPKALTKLNPWVRSVSGLNALA